MAESDHYYMTEALTQARMALDQGEVPVGAVAVMKGSVLARTRNFRETWKDPVAHAEMIAIREAAKELGRWRLQGLTLYVTVEPCAMCAGAIILARIDRLVFGCWDFKAGACGSVFNIVKEPKLNHQVDLTSGVLEEECGSVLKEFFSKRRNERLSK